MKISLLIPLLLLTLLLPVNLVAAELSPVQVAERLQAKYDSTTTLTASFNQVTSAMMSRRKKEGKGTMQLLKPGKMRWDYTEPDQQVIVCDGENISMYFAREKQMILSPAKQYLESDVTYSFFAGTGNLVRDFEILAPDGEELETELGTQVIKIVPKNSHPQIEYILLWADTASFEITQLKITDKFGAITELFFHTLQFNTPLSEETFKYTPPADTEIIRQ